MRLIEVLAAAALLAACVATAQESHSIEAGARRVAITVDDLPVVSRIRPDTAFAREVTAGILGALVAHGVEAVGFVNEQKLEPGASVEPALVRLLRRWLEAGQELGNHTFGHTDLHAVPVEDFLADIDRGDRVISELATDAGRPLRWFRHPFLHTGRDSVARARVEGWLGSRGYRVAPVTIDNADYLFAAAYDHAIARGDSAGAARVRTEYLAYMEAVIAFYEDQARVLIGREIPQVLLIHANALNAEALGDLLAILAGRGYRFITLEEAVSDPAYRSSDRYFGPGGITWLHRWALTRGLRGSVFAGEPVVPEWIVAAAAAIE